MKTHRYAVILSLAGALILAANAPALARTKLVALPARQALSLNLDHPVASLVTEERTLNLRQGNNHVDFSWQGVQIDPNTIQIEVLAETDAVRLIHVAYPPGENALVWNFYSPDDRRQPIRIYYLLSGLQRTVTYREYVAADEKNARLEARYLLANASGEDLSNARIYAGISEPWSSSLRDRESREVTLFEKPIPVEKSYIYHAPSTREQTPLYYILRNTTDNGLGAFKLPGGKIRIFQDDPQGARVFLGEDWLKDLPINEKAEVTLGMARDVVVDRNVIEDIRQNEKRRPDGQIVLSDRSVKIRYEIENFKDTPVLLEIVEPMSDNWGVESWSGAQGLRWERKDNQTLQLFAQLPASGKKQTLTLHFVQKNQIARLDRLAR